MNIGRFKYPKNSIILEIHTKNNKVRQIQKEELLKLAEADKLELVTICQYYVRDNRLFEVYLLYQILITLKIFNKKMNRKIIEEKILKKLNVINNGNWRNAFITLSSLGIIGENSKVLSSQFYLYDYSIEEFINLLYEEYLYPFIDILMEVLLENSIENEVDINNQEILNKIKEKYKGKEILFLTESKGRYISSWLNILRDDFGCIEFEARKTKRVIKFIPAHLHKQERIRQIRNNTIAKKYCVQYEKIKEEIIKGVFDENK